MTAPSAMEILFWGVLTFSLLIVVHEGGHFLAARAFRVKVHEFMIGLPGPAVRVRINRTDYGITAIPLGGYVRIAGMELGCEDALLAPALRALARTGRMNSRALATMLQTSVERASALLVTLVDWDAAEYADLDRDTVISRVQDDLGATDEELLAAARQGTYRGLKTWQRIVVLAMGILANLLIAILVFTVTLSAWGYEAPSLTLGDVLAEGPAAAAGMRPGDKVTSLDGVALAEWQDLLETLPEHNPGDQVTVGYTRDGVASSASVTLGRTESGGPLLGIQSGLERVRFGVGAAFVESVRWTGLVFLAIRDLFNPSTFRQTLEGARSVIGISVEVTQAAKQGPINYAWWIAFLSSVLGVMNLLPIPPLDGGKVALELVERLIGRPIERRIALGISLTGFAVLFVFMVYVMYADVMRYFVNA